MSNEQGIPRHVAIIMDGNRRWARARGVPEAQGHAAGVEAIRPIVEHASDLGVEVLTIYAFSRENWQRSSHEVETLIGLLEASIRDETPRLVEQGVQVRLAGRLSELPAETRASIEQAITVTAGGERMVLNVAFNYSSRSEIVDAVLAYVDDGNPVSGWTRKGWPATSTPPICPTRTCSSAPAATSASATSCCGRRPTPSSTSVIASGPTSRPPSSTPRWPSSPAGPAGSGARRPTHA